MSLGSNRHLLEKVSGALAEFSEEFVFIGGAIVEFLITDAASPSVRATKDVDLVVNATKKPLFDSFEAKLRGLGFKQDLSDDPPVIRRWLVEGVQVDIMPSGNFLGFGNQWYPQVLKNWFSCEVAGQRLKIVTAPFFIATKVVAYRTRKLEPHLESIKILVSHDSEDIIAVVNGREELLREIERESEQLRSFLSEFAKDLLSHDLFEEAIEGHLGSDRSQTERVLTVFQSIANQSS